MNILVTAALAFFFAVGLGLAAFGGIRAAWRGLGRRRGVSAALAAFAVVATICAQKPGPTPVITVDALLRDAGCYATNDVFHAAVSNAPAYAAIDFSACPVLVYARERDQTNAADWAELTPRRTFSELPADYAIVNATNYNYLVYLDYVPPSPVHTNGVFELHGFMVPGDEPGNLEQLAAGFINSRAVTIRDVPYDSEVEYLESTGTQWIDTETKPSEDLATYITFSYQQIANNVSAFGSRSNSTVNDRYWLNYDSKFEIGYGNWGSAVETTSVGAINTIAFNEIDDGNHTFTVNGRSITFSGTPNTSVNIIVFGRVVGSTAPVLSKMRLYSMSMKRGGVLIHDYIPVRVGTTGELYDRVSGTLATRHGDFQYGADVVPVEYLESTGSQYINTGVAPNSQTRWVLDAMFSSTSTSAFMAMGAISSNPTRRFVIAREAGNKASLSYGTYDNVLNVQTHDIRQTYEIDAPNFTWKAGATSGAFTQGTFDITGIGNIFLFARSRNGSVNANNIGSRVYRSSIYNSGVLIQDLVPVRIGTEGAMMDTLTRRIYRNAGTGNFGYGNDK